MSGTGAISSSTLPLAHVGHYLWILYVVPVLIVIGGILKTALAQRREDRDDPSGGDLP